jgi:hypothetical protein
VEELNEIGKQYVRALNAIFDRDLIHTRMTRKRLTIEEVISIRGDYLSGGYTQAQIADKYNCTQGHISKIINHRIWPIHRERNCSKTTTC